MSKFDPKYSVWFLVYNKFCHSFVDSTEIRQKYSVSDDMDTVLLFNENSSRPVASISMKDIPTLTLHNIIASNQYLALPRLSSQVLIYIL